jgi:hypothetical protein
MEKLASTIIPQPPIGGSLGKEFSVSITTDSSEFLVLSLKQCYFLSLKFLETQKNNNSIWENDKILAELKVWSNILQYQKIEQFLVRLGGTVFIFSSCMNWILKHFKSLHSLCFDCVVSVFSEKPNCQFTKTYPNSLSVLLLLAGISSFLREDQWFRLASGSDWQELHPGFQDEFRTFARSTLQPYLSH